MCFFPVGVNCKFIANSNLKRKCNILSKQKRTRQKPVIEIVQELVISYHPQAQIIDTKSRKIEIVRELVISNLHNKFDIDR